MARVLVVDDAMVMRLLIKRILEGLGHKVVAEASNGKEALNQYIIHKPDLVTMDLTMPEANGVEAIGMIRAKYPEAVIIMISAITQKDLIVKSLARGAKGYIIKPFEKEKLEEVVNKALNIKASDIKNGSYGNTKNSTSDIMKSNDIDKAIGKIQKSINAIDKTLDVIENEK